MSAFRRCLLILAFVHVGSSVNTTSGSDLSSCISEEVEDLNQLVVFVGWPHKIVCKQLKEGLDTNFFRNLSGTDEVTCKVFSANGSLLFEEAMTYKDISSNNAGYLLSDMKEGDPVNFTLQLFVSKLGKCVSRKILLQLKPFVEATCEENGLKAIKSEASIGGVKEYTCDVDASTYPKVYAEEVSYKWTRNCTDIPQDLKNGEYELHIQDIGFEDPGMYACAVTYKGMTRYTTQYNLCVQYSAPFSKPTMSCKDPELKKNPGQTATFEGTGTFGAGSYTSLDVFFRWRKQFPNGSFTSWRRCSDTPSNKTRIRCIFTIPTKPCFNYITSEEERKKTVTIIPFQLAITNIDESDYGMYQIMSNTAYDGSKEMLNMTLSKNSIPYQKTIILILVSCVGALIFMVCLMAIIAYKFSLYIKIQWKRMYGAYDIEERQYGAYMAYHFSDEIDKFARESIKESVSFVRQQLEDMRYTTYDEARNGFQSPNKAENIECMIRNCHRIVIFLTLDYVKDDWSLQKLYKGLDEMVRSGTKLILILHPGIKEYLKQHRYDTKTIEKSEISNNCASVERAIYLSPAIEWSNDKKFNSKLFNLRLELAMPKLRSQKKQKTERFLSTSSNGFDSLYDYKDITYQRGLSCVTQFTEIYIPDGQVVDTKPKVETKEECKGTYL